MTAAIMNHLWQSTLFVLAAAIAAAALRKNGAHIRHGVWVIASLKFLAPFSLLMSLGAALPSFTPAAAVIADTTTAAAPALPLAAGRFAEPFTRDDFVPADTLRATASTRNWMPAMLLVIWMTGVLAVAMKRIRGWRRIRTVVRQSTPVPLRSPIPVRSAPGLLEPGVVGVRRPVLLVPAGIEQRLTPPQFDAVMAHEFCHVQRRDNLTAAIHMVVEAVFWFHPLVWWIGARMVEERERACDEYVLRALGEPQNYAESILNVCKLYVESPLACISGVSGADLKKRVAAIMVNRIGTQLTRARKTALALAVILAVVIPLVIGTLTSPARAFLPQEPVSDVATSEARPSFEVASVKPSMRCEGITYSPITTSPGRLNLSCQTLYTLVYRAYGQMIIEGKLNLQNVEIIGGPDWIKTNRYDIDAKAEGAATAEQMTGPMLQMLLEKRFRLKVHKEIRIGPVYEMTMVKKSENLQPTKEGSCTSRDLNNINLSIDRIRENAMKGGAAPKHCGSFTPHNTLQTFSADFYGNTMKDLAYHLRSYSNLPVIDKTELVGQFDFHLEFAFEMRGAAINGMSLPPAMDNSAASIGPSIFDALKQQLGLKLTKTTGPREVIVIDYAEKPSPD